MTTTTTKGTLIGFSAIVMWGTLPALIKLGGSVQPFQFLLLTFATSSVLVLLWWMIQGAPVLKRLSLPWPAALVGIGGIFGFHALYVFALKEAPPVDALLIINLWPLLIVVFSLFLFPGAKLTLRHIAGIAAALAGMVVLTTKGEGFTLDERYLDGYTYALGCALLWSTYSVLCRKFAAQIPPYAIGSFCLYSLAGSAICFWLKESWQPLDWEQAGWTLLTGLGPVGAAFFTWDYGMKHGDIRTLGILSYCGPLIGAGLLILLGFSEFTDIIAIAGALILGGAFISALPSRRAKMMK